YTIYYNGVSIGDTSVGANQVSVGSFLEVGKFPYVASTLPADWRTTVAISGPSQSFGGPHITHYVSSVYPAKQTIVWDHDNISDAYDAYTPDNSSWTSGGAGAFRHNKTSNKFSLQASSATSSNS